MTEKNSSGEVQLPEETVESRVELATFYGIKAGMTRVFDEKGAHVPVTIIKLVPNIIPHSNTKLPKL